MNGSHRFPKMSTFATNSTQAFCYVFSLLIPVSIPVSLGAHYVSFLTVVVKSRIIAVQIIFEVLDLRLVHNVLYIENM